MVPIHIIPNCKEMVHEAERKIKVILCRGVEHEATKDQKPREEKRNFGMEKEEGRSTMLSAA